MSQKSYPFPELRQLSRFLGPKNEDAIKEMDQLRLARNTITADSTAAPYDAPLPLAKYSQGKWVAIVKVSADANLVRAVTQGTDKVNGAAAKNIGTAQYSHMIFGNDGILNWYQIA